MRITFVGSGDAFGSGGRLQTCFHIARPGFAPFLLDCGATALVGLNRYGFKTNEIETVFITHLHGDHFGGLVWLLLDGVYGVSRTRPLTVFGPPTTEARIWAALEALYPGAIKRPLPFAFEIREILPGQVQTHDSVGLEALVVDHPSGAPSYALKLTSGGRTLVFSGDTAWTEGLVGFAQGADVLILDCWQPAGAPSVHMSYAQIAAHAHRFVAGKIVLTHMASAMLDALAGIDHTRFIASHDGLALEV